MAQNYRRKNRKNGSSYYGFGTLGVTSVRSNDAENVWDNVDTRLFTTHKPLRSFEPLNAYPNFKYAKPKKRKKKKKKKQLISPLKSSTKPLVRPPPASSSSTAKSKSPKLTFERVNGLKNSKNDSESIQFELMKEHMKQLKQEISDQVKRNQTDEDNHTSSPKGNKLKKSKHKNKKPIFVPTSLNDKLQTPSDGILSSPTRPRHQSFQRAPESGGSRPIVQVLVTKKKSKKNQNVHVTAKTSKSEKPAKKQHQYRQTRRKRPRSQYVYPSHTNQQPIALQAHIHTVNVGTDSMDNRLSSTFASNTPRIFPLNKKNKKPQRSRPWSTKPHKTRSKPKQKHSVKTRYNKSKQKQKRKHKSTKQKRPKSAPTASSYTS
eukprot:47057_1